MKIAISGAAGAMGRRVVCLACETPDYEVVAALERAGHPDLGKDAGTLAGLEPIGLPVSTEPTVRADVLIDFSAPDAAHARALWCAEEGVAVLIGTTGLTGQQLRDIETGVARSVAVLVAANMSLGVNLFFALAEQAARALPGCGEGGYDVEIIEAHHRRKKDAPSGTALTLARRVCAALGRDPEQVLLYGRQGAAGPRSGEEIAIHAVRGGDIVGDHTIVFAAEGERIEIAHRASSRDVFARGALRAAAFLAESAAGFYTMADVLA